MQSLSDPGVLEENSNVTFREQTAIVDADRFETIQERAAEKVGVVVVGITNSEGELLLVKTDWSEGWVFPGSSVARGADWVATAKEAVENQTGVEVDIDRVARVNRRYYRQEETTERFSSGYAVVFLGSIAEDEPTVEFEESQNDYITDRGWFDRSPDNVDPGNESELWLFVN